MTHKNSAGKNDESAVQAIMAAQPSPGNRAGSPGGSDQHAAWRAGETEWFRTTLLAWYDRHRRVLPWRALPGQAQDPYKVWLSEIMLQQTTVGAVVPYFILFTERWPSVTALANARDEDIMSAWAGLGYYSRARNLHKCARDIVTLHGGQFPDMQEKLRQLPGIGDYTSAAIAAIAFDRPAIVIDGNIERVVSRYCRIEEPLPQSKKTIRSCTAVISENRQDRPGDFAQAMMDLGSAICIPKNPRCVLCPLFDGCRARRAGLQNELPRRTKKLPRPKRTGYAYWITNDEGQILLCRRPDSGLLGGMVSLPSSAWQDDSGNPEPVHAATFSAFTNRMTVRSEAFVRHVFTHFELKLIPVRLEWHSLEIPEGYYWGNSNYQEWGLPTVFRKIAAIMHSDEQ